MIKNLFAPQNRARQIANGFLLALSMFAITLTGCSMCCGPYDYHYPTYGGRLQRANPTWGRVGSVLSDPYAAMGPSADSNLTAPDYEIPNIDDPLDEDPFGEESEFGDRETTDESPSPGPESIQPREDTETEDSTNSEARRWQHRPLRSPAKTWR